MSTDTENYDSHEHDCEVNKTDQQKYEENVENRTLSFLRESLMTSDVLSRL